MWSEHPSIHTKIVCIWELLLLLFGGGADSRPHSFGGMSFGGVWIFPSKTRPSRALILGMRLLHTWQEAIPINFGPAQSLLAGLRIYSMDGWSEGSRRSKERKKERKLYIHFNFVGNLARARSNKKENWSSPISFFLSSKWGGFSFLMNGHVEVLPM